MGSDKIDKGMGESRRDFLKKISMGMGALFTYPALSAFDRNYIQPEKYYRKWRSLEELQESEKLGIALVGLGSYATYQLAPALQKTKLCRLSGAVTGTPTKKEKWASEYGIPEQNFYNYETFDQIADNPDIDIIYIVLPNGLHAEYTIRAAEAGKHVICEKPMATNVADAEAMVEACKKDDIKLSIGYRLHFEPHNQQMMYLGQDEIFGPVTGIEGGHAFRISGENPDRWRLDGKLSGGGPLMDVGIYVVQGMIYTLGELPLAVTASEPEKKRPDLFDEVEETITWELEFPGGVTGRGETSYSYGANYLDAEAEDGWFKISPAYSYGGISGETSKGEMDFPQVEQQTMQMDAFADCIINNHESRVPGEMGVRDMKILMAIYEASETGKRIQFDWS